MIEKRAKQPEFPDFYLPFGGRLRPDNKWVLRARLLPWAAIERKYSKGFSMGKGRKAIPARVAFGALLVQVLENLTDRQTVEFIAENPYVQYFLGYKEFLLEDPFDHSSMVRFRKRLPKEDWDDLNELLVGQAVRSRKASSETDDSDGPGASGGNSGKLIVDATCAPVDVKRPSDLGLLGDARAETEKLIDELYDHCREDYSEKPRTYRKKARRRMARVVRMKKPPISKIRKECRWQLNAVERNLVTLSELSDRCGLDKLSPRQRERLDTILRVYGQYCDIVRDGETPANGKIYNLFQPHVRAIYRGKAGATYEFGAKISVGIANGYAFVDRLEWDPYNECHDVPSQLLAYHRRFGCFPESLHADKIYHTRSNRELCKELGIRLSAVPLGRPGPDHDEVIAQLRRDEKDRNAVEGKFGQCKRRFGLDRIMTKLRETSESMISAIFLAANLVKWEAEALLGAFLRLLHGSRNRLRRLDSNRETPSKGGFRQAKTERVAA